MARNLDDILDVVFDSRDVIERFDELEATFTDDDGDMEFGDMVDEKAEYETIKALIDEMDTGDNDWPYGLALIRDDYFEDYARELAVDIGAIDAEASWPNSYVDWEAAARALQMDYTSVEILGETYWYR